MNNKKVKLIISAYLLFLFVLLDFSYRTFLIEELKEWCFSYSYDFYRTLFSFSVILFFLYSFVTQPSTKFMIFINTLNLTYFVISASVLFKDEPKYTFQIYYLNLLFAAGMLFIGDKRLNIKKLCVDSKLLYYLMILYIFIVSAYVVIYVGDIELHFSEPLFSENSKFRYNISDDFTGFLGYLFNWCIKIFIPIVIIKSLKYKKYLWLGITLILTLFLYLYLNIRFLFFIGFVVLIFALLNDYRRAAAFFVLLLVLSGALGIFLRYTAQEPFWESLVLRRLIIVPQFNNIPYFELFHDKHLHLSYSILSGLFEYPLKLDPAKYVGKYFYHRLGMSANNGFISQGYADFGILGSLAYSLFVIVLFLFFNSLDISPIYAGLFISFWFNLVSTFITTLMMTHGGFLLIFMLYFFAEKQSDIQPLINSSTSLPI